MIEAIGWIGGILFALCAIPQAYECHKVKGSTLNKPFLLMWFFGEILTIAYVLLIETDKTKLPLLLNYVVNILCLLVIMRYTWFPSLDYLNSKQRKTSDDLANLCENGYHYEVKEEEGLKCDFKDIFYKAAEKALREHNIESQRQIEQWIKDQENLPKNQ